MKYEQLWAPWRLGYVKRDEPTPPPRTGELAWMPGSDPACFICCAVADNADRDNLVVHRGEDSITILNRYPYNNGHLLVATKSHKGGLGELTDQEHLETMKVTDRLVGLLERLMNAEGFNIGLNLGQVAGAGLPGHLHWHIVPRWHGDTNFMPSLAGIKVIPQSLDALWELLTDALSQDPASSWKA